MKDTQVRYDWSEVQTYYDLGYSSRECGVHFGFTKAAWHKAVQRKEIKGRSALFKLDTHCILGKKISTMFLKKKLIEFGVLEDKCYECGLPSYWNGKPLTLQLHHVNGNKVDNRVENLTIQCPNCHTQTENWGAKKRKTAE